MNEHKFRRKFAGITLGMFLVTQLLATSAGLLLPKPAKAQWAVVVVNPVLFTTEVANTYDVWKEIGIGIMRELALRISEKFITKFVNKLVEKYKIRNFLYYDQVLTNYYLTNFIRDKITDPDLRQIYVLLEAGYITGQPTGANRGTGPDPRQALIPRLKKAISDLYKEKTGVDPTSIANPPSDPKLFNDYFRQAQYFYLNNPGFTESNLRGRYGEFQSAATTAAQLEVLVGNSIKAGRFIGGTCNTGADASTNPTSPESCTTAGGIWEPSALDQARSFIENPTEFIRDHIDGMIKARLDANFDPNNYWAIIGSLIGSFLFNQFFLDKPNGVLNEDPRGYTPGDLDYFEPQGTEVDIDGDGLPDGYDYTGDGQLDICRYGGTAPDCTGSVEALTIDPPPTGGSGGTTICPDNEVSIDPIYHAALNLPTASGDPYDRLAVHAVTSDIPNTGLPLGPDLVDDDILHVPPTSALIDFGNILLRTSGGAGGYVTQGPFEREVSAAAGVERHTLVPDSGTWIVGIEPGGGTMTVDLSSYAEDEVAIGAFFRSNNGDGYAELCTPRSNVRSDILVILPEMP